MSNMPFIKYKDNNQVCLSVDPFTPINDSMSCGHLESTQKCFSSCSTNFMLECRMFIWK